MERPRILGDRSGRAAIVATVAALAVLLVGLAGWYGIRKIGELEQRVASLDEQVRVAEERADRAEASARTAAEQAVEAGEAATAASERAEQEASEREVAEAERLAAQAEARVARDQADEAARLAERRQAEADEAARLAELMEAEAEAARAEAERIREEREREIAALHDALGEIADTQRTALGLVMNLGEDAINFDFDRAELRPADRELLSRIAGVLLTTRGYRIQVFGHTDDQGSAEYNQRLSERRARAVADYLAEAGIDPSIMTVRGWGKEKPLLEETTDEARARNRRVELGIIDTTVDFTAPAPDERR